MKTILLGLALCLTFAAALAQNLSVTFPKNGAVFQRNGTQGTISVMGSYNSVSFSRSFRTVRATLRKLDVRSGQVIQPEVSYTFVLERRNSFFPGSTFFAGKITVDQGWYELTTQVFNNLFSFTPIGSPDIRKVGVGEVFIIAGQSNAQGLPNSIATGPGAYPNGANNPSMDGVRIQPNAYDGTDRVSYATDNPGRIALLISQALFNRPAPYIADMISVASATPATRIAPLGNSLWYWASVGECIANQYNVPVAFFNTAWEGTTITSYSLSIDRNYGPLGWPANNAQGDPINPPYDPGTPYGAIRNTLRYFGSSYGLRAVLWMQGETDTQAFTDPTTPRWRETYNGERRAITDANDYTNKLRAVITASRTGFGNQLSWVISRTSYNLGVTSPVVISGQNMAINAGDRIYAGPETDGILGRRTGGGEPTHFNNQGLIAAGASWCSVLPNIINTAPPVTVQSLGTEPQSLEISSDGNSIVAPTGNSVSWVNENGGTTDPNFVLSTGQTIPVGQNPTAGPSLGSPPSAPGYGGRVRAFVTNGNDNLIMTQAVTLPYTLVDDTDGGSCDFAQPRHVGNWNGLDVQIRQYGSRVVLVTVAINTATDKHYPRGDDFWNRFDKDPNVSNVEQYRACLNGGNTNYGGLAAPTGLPTPAGYIVDNELDGALFFEQGNQPANCDFNISANSPSVNCSAGVTLTANCFGNNCDNVSYAWSGNGLNQNGQSVSFTAPGSNGSTTYTVTASRPGCSPRSANAVVTVSGCGGNPPTGQSCQEAEAATGTGNVATGGNASGGQYKASYGISFEYLVYNLSVPAAGSYTLKLRAASLENPTAGILVNGGGVQSLPIGNTGGWENFAERSISVSLQAGNNSIRVQGGPGGAFRQDKLCVEGGTVVEPPTSDDNPADGSYEGFFDYANCGTAGGWVWNSSYPNRPIVIEITENGNVVGTVTAGNARPDLVNAGKGNGEHGFSWSIPASLKNGQSRNLSVRVKGRPYVLNNSHAITCSGSARLGSGEPEASGSLVVSPNPSEGQLRVRFATQLGVGYSLRIVDLQGRALQGWQVVGTGGEYDERVEITGSARGTVLVVLEGGGRKESRKVVLVR